MNIEQLARSMREQVLGDAGYRILTDRDLADLHEDLKKIYFHAGRFAGGARDAQARFAHTKMEKIENANS